MARHPLFDGWASLFGRLDSGHTLEKWRAPSILGPLAKKSEGARAPSPPSQRVSTPMHWANIDF